jgi:hypothetical protein
MVAGEGSFLERSRIFCKVEQDSPSAGGKGTVSRRKAYVLRGNRSSSYEMLFFVCLNHAR